MNYVLRTGHDVLAKPSLAVTFAHQWFGQFVASAMSAVVMNIVVNGPFPIETREEQKIYQQTVVLLVLFAVAQLIYLARKTMQGHEQLYSIQHPSHIGGPSLNDIYLALYSRRRQLAAASIAWALFDFFFYGSESFENVSRVILPTALLVRTRIRVTLTPEAQLTLQSLCLSRFATILRLYNQACLLFQQIVRRMMLINAIRQIWCSPASRRFQVIA